MRRLFEMRLLRFTDGCGRRFSAFVALDDEQWAEFARNGGSDLTPYRQDIILLVDGHDPTVKDHQDATAFFKNRYASISPHPGSG